jgi:hypothetical protein
MITIRLAPAMAALGAACLSSTAAAQCRPPAGSHEAKLLAFYEAPIVFSMAAAPERLSPGAIRVGGEAIPVPSPNPALQHPEYCYANTTNNTKLAPIFGRPRLTVGFPGGFVLEASYLPNVTVADAEATIVSVAVARTQALPFMDERLTVALRVDGTVGRVRGAITCPENSLQTADENVPCYGTHPSRDTFHPNSYGGEAAVAMHSMGNRFAAYLGGGIRSLRPRFRAGFTDALGNVDHTTVDVDLLRAAGFAGVTARVRDRIAISTQLYVVPADVTTMRISAQYALR